MRVVAEGVETHKQLSSLRALGCDELQGFYFAPPLEPDRLAARLAIAATE
jgi:EAL domain-containing protein (putative c-di-GMP-specific phosphodiesterase class I)